MFNIRLPSFLTRPTSAAAPRDSRPIKLPPVSTHKVDTNSDKPSRTLKHLLKANHANHAVLARSQRRPNDTPHALGAAYTLGATPEQLNALYNHAAAGPGRGQLDGWADAPGEISREDWRDFLGRREYQRAWLDFFEDQLVQHGYDWAALLDEFLYDDDGGRAGPLVNALAGGGGLAGPLVHLAYALELDSRLVAVEALTLAACFYGGQHNYLDDPGYTRPPMAEAATPLELLHRAAGDERFDGLFADRGGDNLEQVFAKREDALLEYWNAWQLGGDAKAQFEQSQRAAVAMLVATRQDDAEDEGAQEKGHGHNDSHRHRHDKYDYFLCHALTASHAVRVLLPLVDARWHAGLARQWWLFAAGVYVAQQRPRIDEGRIAGVRLEGRDWRWVEHQALQGRWRLDAQFVQACRAIKGAAETWGDDDGFYLRAAVRFAGSFAGWGGFAEGDVEARQEVEGEGEVEGEV